VQPASKAISPPDTQLAASGPWLDRLNAWRASTGVAALTENTTWSAGDYNHSRYMVKNNLVTHYETAGMPYYTSAGDAAARNGNLNVSSTTSETDSQAIDWWMQAPFHAMGLMDPSLTTTGFGSYREVKSGWQMGATVDTLRGNPWSGGHWPVYFPGNGTSEPLRSYDGYESPNPLVACSGYTAPTGLPVFVMTGRNLSTTVGAHSFTGNGTALAHCVIDSHNATLGTSLAYRGSVILIPRQPLQTGVTYAVALTVNNVPYTWSFTVGNFPACTALPTGPGATASLAADKASPQPSGSTVTFTASSNGCSNPEYRYYVQAPGAPWKLARDYGPATFQWNTTGLATGTYNVDVWVHQKGSGTPYEAYSLMPFVLANPLACTGTTLTSNKASPQQTGTVITMTAATTVCPQPSYRFYIKRPNGIWYLMRDYGAATWAWNSAGEAPGTYLVNAWVRQSGTQAAYEDFHYLTFVLSPAAACANATLTSDKASPQALGTVVTFTATATGCSEPVFLFYIRRPNGTWYIARNYGASTFAWNTAGQTAGAYSVDVWIRQNGSGASYETVSLIAYTLT